MLEQRPSSGDSLSGQALGAYRVGPRIDQGGGGDAYLLFDASGETELAARVIAGGPAGQVAALAQAKLPAQFLPIVSSGELPDGKVYVITPRLRGETLARYLARTGPLPWPAAVTLLRDLTRGMLAAHKRGWGHGSLDADSFFVELPDAGDDDDEGTAAVGMVDVLGLQPVQPASPVAAMDIRALGLIFYALIGHRLDDARTLAPPPRVAALVADVPSSLDRIILSMTAVEPDDRPLTLQPVVDGLGALAPDGDAPDGLDAFLREHPPLDASAPPRHTGASFPVPVAATTPLPTPIAPEPPTPARPMRIDENVQFTVYRPRAVAPQRWYPLLAFAHLGERRPDAPADEPDPAQEVARQAQALLGEAWQDFRNVVQEVTHAIPEDGTLTLVPTAEQLEFEPARISLRWRESVHRADFRMRAATTAAGTTARARLTIFLGSIIVGDVPFTVKVDAGAAATGTLDAGGSARAFRRIFASYSHADTFVVRQFEQLAHAMGDRYVGDWIDLRSGEAWSPRLEALIAEADVFQLFWSSSSMRSRWVRQEWEYALSLGRANFVRPTYWELPLPEGEGLPPPALKVLHFARIEVGAPADLPQPARVVFPVAAAKGGMGHPMPAGGAAKSSRRRAWIGAATAAMVLALGVFIATVPRPGSKPDLLGRPTPWGSQPVTGDPKQPPRPDPEAKGPQPPPREALVTLTGRAPAGLTVTVDGKPATLPLRVPAGRRSRVELRAPGYKPVAVVVADDNDVALDEMKRDHQLAAPRDGAGRAKNRVTPAKPPKRFIEAE